MSKTSSSALQAWTLFMLAVALCTLGCDPDAKPKTQQGEGGAEEFTEPRLGQTPLTLLASEACLIDSDCDAGSFCFIGVCSHQCERGDDCASGQCDERGRCLEDQRLSIARGALTQRQLPLLSDSGAPHTLDGVSLVTTPSTQQFINPGQTTLKVYLETSMPVLSLGGLAYRVDSTVSGVDQDQVIVSTGDVYHELTIDTGRANPSHEAGARAEVVYVTTSIRGFELRLIPRRSLDGHYQSSVRLAGFNAQVPFSFDLKTTPAGASFSDASSVSLILGRDAHDLFALQAPETPEVREALGVELPLNWDEIEARWVSTAKLAYHFPSGQLFGALDDDQTQRSLRITLELDNQGRLIGSLRDSWQGLLNAYTMNSDGEGLIPLTQTILITGDFEATRVADLPSDLSPFNPPVDTSAPAPLAYPPPGHEDPCPTDLNTLLRNPDNDPDEPDEPDDPDCALVSQQGVDAVSPQALRSCVDRLKDKALGAQSLSAVLAELFEGEQSNGETFQGFLESCAMGTEARCNPSVVLECSLKLVSVSLKRTNSQDQEAIDTLWASFSQLQLQLIGGTQLIAFYHDVITRLGYLQRGQFEVPSVAEEALAQLNEEALHDWETYVVDGKMTVLRRSMSPEVFLFLSSPRESTTTEDEHTRLLISLVTAWVDAADSLALAARRWSDLHRLDGERREKAARVSMRLRELYISGLVIISYHKAAGRAAEAAPIAQSLSSLISSYELLSLPFSNLIASRDGEIVLSTAVDESRPINAVLEDRQRSAEEAVTEAAMNIEQILAELFESQLYAERRRAEIVNAIGNSEGRLADLCGIPSECSRTDVGADDQCDSSWEPGLCGFIVGRTLLETRSALMIHRAQEQQILYQGDVTQVESCLQTQLDEVRQVDDSACDVYLMEPPRGGAQGEDTSADEQQSDRSEEYQSCINELYDGLNLNQSDCLTEGNAETNWRFDPDAASDSEAGAAILEVIKADLAYESIKAERDQYRRGVILKQKQIESLVEHITRRKAERGSKLEAFKAKIKAQLTGGARILNRRKQQILCLVGWNNEDEGEVLLDETECKCGGQDCGDEGRFAWWQNQRKSSLDSWSKFRSNSAQMQINFLDTMTDYRIAAQFSRDAEYVATTTFEEIRDGFPKGATDASAVARSTIGITSGLIRSALIGTAYGLESAAARKEFNAQNQELIREMTVENLMDVQEHQDLIFDAQNEIQDLEGELAVIENDNQRSIIDSQIDLLTFEAEQIKEEGEDILALEERRAELIMSFGEEIQHDLAVLEAEIDVKHAILKYFQITEQARLERTSLETLRAQRDHFEQLVAGAQAFLTMSSKLEQAERQITRAKGALIDWLTALEFFAVRPFLSERLGVRLARSSYELRAIAERLSDLSSSCGGVTNTQTVSLSLKRDLLKLKDTMYDQVTERSLTPEEQLREVLSRRLIPIDQRVRYKADSNLGSLMQSEATLSASFSLRLSELANLPVSCNAKLKGVSLKVVGEGFQDSLPIVTVLYDGVSQLTSCQPGIAEYVAEFGEGATRYNSITSFEVTGRSASPVAGVGEFGSTNESLSGLPIASRYTLLIDTSLPANQELPWAQLEDIELELSYGYQDLFPVSSECGR